MKKKLILDKWEMMWYNAGVKWNRNEDCVQAEKNVVAVGLADGEK